ncbi:MAG: O-antigen ligase family protein [Elusimicrobia bacterium]|nr:O-antigen ligase family protein [Elusimicrobiota bacterium]
MEKIKNYLPAGILTLTVLLGGGKLLWQFSIVAIAMVAYFIYAGLNKDSDKNLSGGFPGIISGLGIIPDRILTPFILFLTWSAFSLLASRCFFPAFKNTLQITVYFMFFILCVNAAGTGDGFRGTSLITLSVLCILQFLTIAYQKITGGTPYGLFPENPNFAAVFMAGISVACLGYLLGFIRWNKNRNTSDNGDGDKSCNETAGLLNAQCPATVADDTAGESKSLRLLLTASVIAGTVGIFLGHSRTALAALLISGGTLFIMKYKIKAVLSSGIIIAVFLLAGGDKIAERYARINDPLAFYRPSLWNSALKIIRDNPVYGVGLGNYGNFFSRYNFPVSLPGGHTYKYHTDFAHSEPLQVAAELGLPGLLLLVWMAVSLFSGFGGYPFAKAGILTLLFCGLFDLTLHLPANVFMALMLAGLNQRGKTPQPHPRTHFNNKIFSVAGSMASIIILLIYSAILLSEFFAAGNNYPAASKINPFRPEFFYRQGEPYHKPDNTRDLNKKIKSLQKASGLDPENYRYHLQLGELYILASAKDKRQIKNALASLNTAQEKNPYNYLTHIYLGRVFHYLGERTRADASLRRAISLEPSIKNKI